MGGYGWGEVCDADLSETVHAALDSGITVFDTADVYGLGHSEEILGKALGKQRRQTVIATKFGVRYVGGKSVYDNSPAHIEKAVTGSLKRLGTDYIDLYQVHYRDKSTPMEVLVGKLCELRDRGLVRYFGLSNIYAGDITELIPFKNEFVSFQNEYSLVARKNESAIQGISGLLELTPMTWGSLGQGILSGKYTKDTVFSSDDRRSRDVYVNFHGERFSRNLRIVEAVREVAGACDKPVPATAIRFILDYLARSVVLVGIKNKTQLRGNLESVDWQLSPEELSNLLTVSADERE